MKKLTHNLLFVIGLFAFLLCYTDVGAQSNCQPNLKDYPPLGSECSYLLVLEDTVGDGWDGAKINVTINEASPGTEYQLAYEDGYCKVIPIYLDDGEIVDISYTNGSKEEEHYWYILDPLGNIATDQDDNILSHGPTPLAFNNYRLKSTCPTPSCANDYLHTHLEIILGDTPAEQSWELLDGEGNRVIFANAGDYTGIAPGTLVEYDLDLLKCGLYKFKTFDGANNSWDGGTYEFTTANPHYGTPNTNGEFTVLEGPSNAFLSEEGTYLTLPCEPVCPSGPLVNEFFDPSNCSSIATVPVIEPVICYPYSSHASGCDIQLSYTIFLNGDLNDVFTTQTLPFFNSNTTIEIHYTPPGKHKLMYTLKYCDGAKVNCFADLFIVENPDPVMICRDDINLSLSASTTGEDTCEKTILATDLVHLLNTNCSASVNEYKVIITNAQGNEIGDTVGPEHIGQVLKYQVIHCYSGHNCCGEFTLLDNQAPLLVCNDYDVNCTHPYALDPYYEAISEFVAADLPANIAGGTSGALSITEVPIEVACAPKGEIVEDVKIYLNIEHTDIEDLRIFLTAPPATGAPKITLLDYGTCGNVSGLLAPNLYVTFDDDSTIDVEDACTGGSPAISGTYAPFQVNKNDLLALALFEGMDYADLAGTWTLEIYDNDTNGSSDAAAGVGELVDAKLIVNHGFPRPYTAYDCTDLDVKLELEMVMDNNCDLTDWIGTSIMRTWSATDANGNVSSCTQMVNLKAPTMADLQFPADISLNCVDNEDTNPAVTGLPQFGCFDVLDAQESYCDISFTYEDALSSGCNQRIIRTWTVTNWCTTVMKTHKQTIDIVDEQGPSIAMPSGTVNSGVVTCDGSVFINPTVSDDCSGLASLSVTYTIGGNTFNVAIPANGLYVDNIPFGEITAFTILAKDNCGNTNTETFDINVVDDSEPTALCQNDLELALGGSGAGTLTIVNIDAGSTDNCAVVSHEIRRLDGCLGESSWDDFIRFECCDLGTLVTVELRVSDAAGNTNTCQTQVSVIDNVGPSVTCPEDKDITCLDDYFNLAAFGTATANDNCSEPLLQELDAVTEINECGAGTITRTWTARDSEGLTDQCTQTINVSSVAGFSVTFPADVEILGCNTAIGDTGEPIVNKEGCGLITVSQDDQELVVEAGACYKIMRTWTIVDWCTYDEYAPNTYSGLATADPLTFKDDGDGFFKYKQVIKIIDNVSPVINCADDITILDDSPGCEGQVNLSPSASDDCVDASLLEYEYRIDVFNDGTYDIVGYEDSYQDVLPYGTHRILWFVEDACGNEVGCDQLVTLQDGNTPSIICTAGLVFEMGQDGTVSVNASSFVEYMSDDCSESLSVTIRTANTNDIPYENLVYDCKSLGINYIEIIVTDEMGNSDFCETQFILQDNMSVCGSATTSATIAGKIHTVNMENIESATVEIMEMNNSVPTNSSGYFGFDNLNMNGNYTVHPERDYNDLNGVTTLDLVLITKHILGIENLDTPYKMIAADVNSSSNITTYDVIELRKLILYQITELPSNNSWRFVDANYTFSNPNNPWSQVFPEEINYSNLNNSVLDADFIGIKIGDVNNSAIPNFLLGTEDRHDASMLLKTTDATISAGESHTIDFTAADLENLSGFQFTLEFDAESLDFEGFTSGLISLDAENFGLDMLSDGILTASWNSSAAVAIDSEATLFSLTFAAKQPTLVSDAINISNRYTKAEAYNSQLDALEIDLVFGNATVVTKGFDLYQNQPNPFKESTLIAFELPEAATATLSIFDLSGQLIYRTQDDFAKGYNELEIQANTLSKAGVFYYQLETAKHAATKKMIIMQ